MQQDEQSFSEKNKSARQMAARTNAGKMYTDVDSSASIMLKLERILNPKASDPETEPIIDRMKLIHVHLVEIVITFIFPSFCTSPLTMNGEKIPSKK